MTQDDEVTFNHENGHAIIESLRSVLQRVEPYLVDECDAERKSKFERSESNEQFQTPNSI